MVSGDQSRLQNLKGNSGEKKKKSCRCLLLEVKWHGSVPPPEAFKHINIVKKGAQMISLEHWHNLLQNAGREKEIKD